ncbi:MAG: hypothetical protein CSA65_08790 [Proteobacteria bacterium]|nr:MAG: hypothetical protein CSA65_08790 [Pseudomonadota bacterium]
MTSPATAPSPRPAADPQAETLAKAGQLFELKRYGEARALYQLALAEQPQRHGLLLRIAGCDERLGGSRNVQRALKGYRRYLKAKPQSPLRAQVEGRIGRLERRLKDLARSTDGAEPGTVPAYKRWWFWAALVAVVGGVVVGIVLASQVDDDVPTGRGALSTRRGGLSWSF